MIPIQDNIPSRTFPIVNYAIIALCGVTFLLQLGSPPDQLVERLGMVPVRVFHPDKTIEIVRQIPVRTPLGIQVLEQKHELMPSALPPIATLLTCIFLHGGWMHVIGNLWFLYIFGDNVEDRLGHVGYLFFYLVCGMAASGAHLFASPNSGVPTIGASGAVAGVMGAYFLLYPRATVLSVIPIFFFFEMVVLPAPLFLGVWFLLQFLQGTLSITATQAGGVAWWAHIGGFLVGIVIAAALNAIHLTRPPVTARRPNSERPTHYRIHWRE
jgi:hypothetical protein